MRRHQPCRGWTEFVLPWEGVLSEVAANTPPTVAVEYGYLGSLAIYDPRRPELELVGARCQVPPA